MGGGGIPGFLDLFISQVQLVPYASRHKSKQIILKYQMPCNFLDIRFLLINSVTMYVIGSEQVVDINFTL